MFTQKLIQVKYYSTCISLRLHVLGLIDCIIKSVNRKLTTHNGNEFNIGVDYIILLYIALSTETIYISR